MPWHVEERDGEYCVIKDSDGSKAGCHPSREKANAQMRALYSSESRTADIEVDWGDLFDEEPNGNQPLKIEIGQAPSETGQAVVAALEALAARLQAAEERQLEFVEIVQKLKEVVASDQEALVASLNQMAEGIKEAVTLRPEVVVNVPDFPEFPEIPTPVVNVTVEPPDQRRKTVNVTRDPLTGLIASAEISEI